MRLENLLELIDGVLKNSPSIGYFESTVFDAKKIKRGDLFIALEPSEIPLAVLNGAYGIVSSSIESITDSEIAWIEVASIDKALAKLFRFHLIPSNVEAYYCNDTTLELLKQINCTKELFIVESDIAHFATSLWEQQNAKIAIGSNRVALEKLFSTAKPMPMSNKREIHLHKSSIFETTFSYEETLYERQPLSSFFIPTLERVISFLKKKNIEFKLPTFKPLSIFNATFVDRYLREVEFGKSERVLIHTGNLELFINAKKYIQKNIKWSKSSFFLPISEKEKVEYNSEIEYFQSEEELLELLRSRAFGYVLIGLNEPVYALKLKVKAPSQLQLFTQKRKDIF